MDVRLWNDELKALKGIILKKDKFEESKKLILDLHAKVHSSEMSEINEPTYEDELWEDLNDISFRVSQNEKGRTVAYGMWHSSRIEDITMNLLVNGTNQVFTLGKWKEKINSKIIDTGNALTPDEILDFSKDINMIELKRYRDEVGKRSRDIISNLTFEDMKKKFSEDSLKRILDEGAVLDVEASNWLIDFWGKKNVAGIILMPLTRHNMIHINESYRAKKKAKKMK